MKIHLEWRDNTNRDGEPDCPGVIWMCPACGYHHFVYIETPNPWGWCWEFNGDLERPSLKPSVDGDKDNPAKRCHCWITNGEIHYDASMGTDKAEWRGKTVPMVDL